MISTVLLTLLWVASTAGIQAPIEHRTTDAATPRAHTIAGQQALQSGDAADAFHWFTLAAKGGEAEAQVLLADLYLQGRGTARDAAQAAYWYARAAQSSPEAQWKLGALYQQGHGAARNPEIAAALYVRAAEAGLAGAQNSLATLYFTGEGVTRNVAKALELFRQAAAQQYADAQLNLASIYLHGSGVKQDLDEARHWAQQARAAGSRAAAAVLEEIAKAKSPLP